MMENSSHNPANPFWLVQETLQEQVEGNIINKYWDVGYQERCNGRVKMQMQSSVILKMSYYLTNIMGRWMRCKKNPFSICVDFLFWVSSHASPALLLAPVIAEHRSSIFDQAYYWIGSTEVAALMIDWLNIYVFWCFHCRCFIFIFPSVLSQLSVSVAFSRLTSTPVSFKARHHRKKLGATCPAWV